LHQPQLGFHKLGAMTKQVSISALFFLTFFSLSYGQVNEAPNSSVYPFIYRMAQKGIVNVQDYMLPLDRKGIRQLLDTVEKKNAELSIIERKELSFFLQDFYYDRYRDDSVKTILIGKKDVANRFRPLLLKGKDVQIFLDPIVGIEHSFFGGTQNTTTYGGARLWGNLGKNFGFNLSFRDITEIGDSIDFTKSFTEATGIVNTSRDISQLNYSNLNFNIGYKWKNGSISVGKDQLNFGYGFAGKIILSSKAPSFPYIRFAYQPFKWLKFNYFNGWLNSGIVDSSRSYITGTGLAGGYREIQRTKYIAHHSIGIQPMKGLEVAVGESMIYSDKLDIGYLMPINIFKLYDQYASNYSLNGGSNSQIFAQISSRNQLKNTHLYLSLFIDEIWASKIFDKTNSRNQLGYTVGINKTDFFFHYLTFGIEYTRINPFVYNNIVPAQTYFNSSYSLGDWMGNNADRLYIFVDYTPIAKLKVNVSYQFLRKGGEGSLEQQYYQQPQPPFLFGKQFDQASFSFRLLYEHINKLNFFLRMGLQQSRYTNSSSSQQNKEIGLGVSYGL